jgi:hypothetical protein
VWDREVVIPKLTMYENNTLQFAFFNNLQIYRKHFKEDPYNKQLVKVEYVLVYKVKPINTPIHPQTVSHTFPPISPSLSKMEDTIMPLANMLRKTPKNERLVFQFKNSQILDSNNVPKRAGDCTPLEQFQALKRGRMGVATLEREYKQKMEEIIFNYDLDVAEEMSELEASQKKATEINVIEIAHKT